MRSAGLRLGWRSAKVTSPRSTNTQTKIACTSIPRSLVGGPAKSGVELVDPGYRVVEVGLRHEVRRADGNRDHLGVSGEPALGLLELLVTPDERPKLALESLLSHGAGYPLSSTGKPGDPVAEERHGEQQDDHRRDQAQMPLEPGARGAEEPLGPARRDEQEHD